VRKQSKQRKLGKKTVELRQPARPSRIRRDPVPVDQPASLIGNVRWSSREWEIRLALAGIIFFALAISAVVIDIGEILSK
jgi:hypothetical protein